MTPSRAPGRVLMTADAVGGVWTYTAELVREFAERGVETTVAVVGPEPAPARRTALESLPGVRVRTHPGPLDWMADDAAALAALDDWLLALEAEIRPDVVHLNGAAHAALPWRAPAVAVMHSCVATWWLAVRPGGPLPPEWAWHRRRAAEGLAAADAVIVPTAAHGDLLERVYGRVDRLRTVWNGRRPADRRPRSKRDVALTAGRLWDEAKNAAFLDAAAADVPVYAAGPTTDPTGQTIAFRHLRLLGALDQAALRDRMDEAAVFVACPRYEPFGLAVLEAALAGCALVLADHDGFRELWDGAALFVDPDDPEALVAGLRALLRPGAARAALADAARERARRYGAAAMAEGTLDVHRSTLAARAGTAPRPRDLVG